MFNIHIDGRIFDSIIKFLKDIFLFPLRQIKRLWYGHGCNVDLKNLTNLELLIINITLIP